VVFRCHGQGHRCTKAHLCRFRACRQCCHRCCGRAAHFRAGYVLYCGNDSLSFGDGLACLPISALWTTDAGRDARA
jgi:hypothetical protein